MKDQRSPQQISNDVKEYRNYADTFRREQNKFDSEMAEHLQDPQDFKPTITHREWQIRSLKANIQLGRSLISGRMSALKHVDDKFKHKTRQNIYKWLNELRELTGRPKK